MTNVDSYFKKHIDKITFLELKKDTDIGNGKYSLKKELPLPIKTDSLINGIKEGNLQNEIDLSLIIDGIIFLMGTDPNFPYIEDYKDILYKVNENIHDYVFYSGIKYVEKKDNDSAAIYFRALKLLDPKNINGIFNYAIILEEISKKYFDLEMEEKAMEFIKASTRELESILDINEQYPLAYYKLGYHYKFSGNFIKAKLIWNKYLTLDKDELRLQEVREELASIEDDVEIERGLIHLEKDEFQEAIDIFEKLAKKYDNFWELKYFLGASYKGMGDFENAIELFYEALDLNMNNLDVYNELGICLVSLGKTDEAIDIFTVAIENLGNDYRLLYNRGLCYLQMREYNKAYDDISMAASLNVNDINIRVQKERLEKLLNK